MSEMVYKWRLGPKQFPIEAQAAGEELERLRAARNGNLIAAHVVEAAKRKTSVLHGVFEWDDKKAAHMHRLDQASGLIRHMVVVSIGAKGEPVTTRAFVNVDHGDARGYT